MAQVLSTNTFTAAKWIVNPDATKGTHTTITAATSSASSGDTILITDGTYTENFNCKAGVAYVAYSSTGYTPNVIINGEITGTAAGVTTFSGLQIKTNSLPCVNTTGSNATILYFIDCYFLMINNSILVNNGSSSSQTINCYNCVFDQQSTGSKVFSIPEGNLNLYSCVILNNAGAGTFTSTLTGASIGNFYNCAMNLPIQTSNTATLNMYCCEVLTTNTAGVTVSSTSTLLASGCYFSTGTASCISTAGTSTLVNCNLNSSNTNVLTGAGTTNSGGCIFSGSSSGVNATTYNTYPLTMAQGGTNAKLTASNGGIFYSTASAAAILAGTATANQALLSGSSTTPEWSTATYPATTTANQLLYSSATNTISGLTSGDSLLAATNASGTLSMRAFSINVQVFSGHGTYTYTPTTGMLYCTLEAVGGGGGGAGAGATGSTTVSAGGGGSGGSYSRKTVSAATIGTSVSVVVGQGGAGGTGNQAGSNGTASTVGSTIISAGYGGGGGNAGAAIATSVVGGTSNGASGGDINIEGVCGGSSFGAYLTTGAAVMSGAGGASYFGGGGTPVAGTNTSSNGNAGPIYGSGGSGGGNTTSQSAVNGGAGSDGVVVITEYIIN